MAYPRVVPVALLAGRALERSLRLGRARGLHAALRLAHAVVQVASGVLLAVGVGGAAVASFEQAAAAELALA